MTGFEYLQINLHILGSLSLAVIAVMNIITAIRGSIWHKSFLLTINSMLLLITVGFRFLTQVDYSAQQDTVIYNGIIAAITLIFILSMWHVRRDDLRNRRSGD